MRWRHKDQELKVIRNREEGKGRERKEGREGRKENREGRREERKERGKEGRSIQMW